MSTRTSPPSGHPPLAGSLAALTDYAGSLVGAGAGLLAGLFGVIAGFLLGWMLDAARREARVRKRLSSFMKDPDGYGPASEALPGLASAAAIALSAGATAPPLPAREDFEALCASYLALERSERRDLDRILDVAPGSPPEAAAAHARRLATSGCPVIRRLLADFAYARLADRAALPEAAAEASLRAVLADCGLSALDLARARERAFPGLRDPWEVLGLEPGASPSEIKRAYRRLSRKHHPDAAAGEGGTGGQEAAVREHEAAERFREIKEAYELLNAGFSKDRRLLNDQP